jgi:hypothetical protein
MRGQQETVVSKASILTDFLHLLETSFSKNVTDLINYSVASNKAVISVICQNQATAYQVMVARHTKNYDLPSYKE